MKNIKFITTFTIVITLLSVASFAGGFDTTRSYNGNFKDVASSEWYADSIAKVYELKLMEGVSSDKFDIDSQMSVAQAITIAARLHSIYNDTQMPENASGANWYSNYVSYCLENGIISENQFDTYNRPVLSFEMVQLFASALPDEYFPEINNITYIQDVPESVPFEKDVMMFYKAGVLNGNDQYGSFLPVSAITRKRAAVILSRTVLPEKRITYTLAPKREEYSVAEVMAILASQTVRETLDSIYLIGADEYTVSAAEYRYYNYVSQNDSAKLENQIKSSATIINVLKDMNLMVSYDVLGEILSAYYTARTDNYAPLSYFDALEAQKLSDAVYAKIIATNELYYQGIKKEAELISDDYIYNYALDNNYICAKNIFISKNEENAYKTALEIKLSLLEGADFDELCSKYGQYPGKTFRKGGFYFTNGWLVKDFENAAFALEENEISDIVESELGYHIIKRLPLVKEELFDSADYTIIASNAGSDSFYKKLSSEREKIVLDYVDNFENLSNLLK